MMMMPRRINLQFRASPFYLHQGWMQSIVILITVFFLSAKSEECGNEEIAMCAKPLKVLSETTELTFVSEKEDLDRLCPDLHTGLNCIRSYTRRCMNIHQREHFNKLYHGISQAIGELCESGQYQEDFLRHAPCMKHVKREYEMCSNRYQGTIMKLGQSATESKSTKELDTPEKHLKDEGMRHEMCCSFMEFIDCSERVVRHTCGYETANFSRNFLEKMSNSIMTMHCDDYRNRTGTGKCGEPFSPSESLVPSVLVILFMVFSGLLIVSIGNKY